MFILGNRAQSFTLQLIHSSCGKQEEKHQMLTQPFPNFPEFFSTLTNTTICSRYDRIGSRQRGTGENCSNPCSKQSWACPFHAGATQGTPADCQAVETGHGKDIHLPLPGAGHRRRPVLSGRTSSPRIFNFLHARNKSCSRCSKERHCQGSRSVQNVQAFT